jgi:hypothetical protein
MVESMVENFTFQSTHINARSIVDRGGGNSGKDDTTPS